MAPQTAPAKRPLTRRLSEPPGRIKEIRSVGWPGSNEVSPRNHCGLADARPQPPARDFRTGTQRLMTLTAHEFLARWFEHVPPRGLRTISHSGLYANARVPDREAARTQIQAAQSERPASEPTRPVHTFAPHTCPRCNHPLIRRPVGLPLANPPRSRESPLAVQPHRPANETRSTNRSSGSADNLTLLPQPNAADH